MPPPIISRIIAKLFPPSRRAFCLAAWLLWLMPARVDAAAVEVPPRPENYLLDRGDIFSPEMRQRMVEALTACARDYDVHIYVMTMPPFQVMPSRSTEKLNQLHSATRMAWLKGQVGALIIFDDEVGRALLGESDEARKVFSPVALDIVLQNPKLQSKKKRSGGEKLTGTVMLLIREFTDLRAKSNDEARKQRTMNIAFATVAGAVVLGGVGLFLVKRRGAKSRPPHHARKHSAGNQRSAVTR